MSGPSAGRSVTLGNGAIRIGSGRGCELVLQDRTVSATHAEVEIVPGGVRIRDRGSKNGVRTGSTLLEDGVLPLGSIVTLGGSEIALGSPVAPPATRESYGALVGVSEPMQRLFALLERLEQSEATALILGESGTGKEVVARAIHEASRRSGGPFVVFDCGGMARGVAESELFGHVRGAFTDAAQDRTGAIESAHGGTLFLDEIGEVPLELQPKLLRVLERREVKRVGADTVRRMDVRFLAATNRDLAMEVAKGRFRQDLYFRLAVIQVDLPPLRLRREDVGPIARQMLLRAGRSAEEAEHLVDRVAALRAYPWPGNCRELRNAIDHLLALGEVPPAIGKARARGDRQGASYHRALADALEEFERAYAEALIRESRGVMAEACRLGRIDRKVVRRLFRKYGPPSR